MTDRSVFGYLAVALLSVASLQCESAMAGDSERGFYTGLAVGRAQHSLKGFGNMVIRGCRQCPNQEWVDPDRISVDDADQSWNIEFGYRVNRYFAAEVSYNDFGSITITEHYPGTPLYHFRPYTMRSEADVTGLGLTLLGSLPLSSSVSAVVRGGVLFAKQDIVSDSPDLLEYPAEILPTAYHRKGTVATAAAGLRWSFAPRWSTQLEYQVNDVFDIDENDYPRVRSDQIKQTSLSFSFDL